jgi:hypothetical protein
MQQYRTVTAASEPTGLAPGEIAFNLASPGSPRMWIGVPSSVHASERREFTGAAPSVTVSDTVPATAEDGDLWWNTANGQLYVYFDDAAQWIIANSAPTVIMASVAPSGPLTGGDLWWDTANGQLYVWYEQGGGQWVIANSTRGILTVSDTAPLMPEGGDLWWDSVSGSMFIWFVGPRGSQWVQNGA